jgi:hypothetical protein
MHGFLEQVKVPREGGNVMDNVNANGLEHLRQL